jgi:DNA mismatch repair ATPase MutL
MKHKPAYVINISLPTASYDINLSPDKREIAINGESVILESLKSHLDALYAPTRNTFSVQQGNGKNADIISLFSMSTPEQPTNCLGQEKVSVYGGSDDFSGSLRASEQVNNQITGADADSCQPDVGRGLDTIWATDCEQQGALATVTSLSQIQRISKVASASSNPIKNGPDNGLVKKRNLAESANVYKPLGAPETDTLSLQPKKAKPIVNLVVTNGSLERSRRFALSSYAQKWLGCTEPTEPESSPASSWRTVRAAISPLATVVKGSSRVLCKQVGEYEIH